MIIKIQNLPSSFSRPIRLENRYFENRDMCVCVCVCVGGCVCTNEDTHITGVDLFERFRRPRGKKQLTTMTP